MHGSSNTILGIWVFLCCACFLHFASGADLALPMYIDFVLFFTDSCPKFWCSSRRHSEYRYDARDASRCIDMYRDASRYVEMRVSYQILAAEKTRSCRWCLISVCAPCEPSRAPFTSSFYACVDMLTYIYRWALPVAEGVCTCCSCYRCLCLHVWQWRYSCALRIALYFWFTRGPAIQDWIWGVRTLFEEPFRWVDIPFRR